MEVNTRDRFSVWTPLLFSMVLIFGMIVGFNLKDSLRNKRDLVTVIQRNDRLDEIIDLVHEKYVDTIDNNVLYNDAVTGILQSLDPHTVYIPADEVQEVNDDLDGSFSGVGIEFSILHDTIGVTSVIENGPAGIAGIEAGDQLLKVGDSIVAGVNITAEQIAHLLKGKQKSKVTLTIKQVVNGQVKDLALTRDIIPTRSVEASIMLDSRTGYIKINRFSANTADEFKAALAKLQKKGAQQLIVDLRENPGGYLDAATTIADNFLDDNKLVVYTKGIHTTNTEYRSKEKGMFEKGKLAVLVDENSASASEILAGAIQDWDRGVIVGRRTFGKGLVQEQYELPDGAALRLTIARYYTPSGRCIQRSFSKGKEAYMEDYEKRLEQDTLLNNDTSIAGDTIPFYTANHRLVYGGGGIKPDLYVPSRLSLAIQNMIYSSELKSAIWDYFIHNREQLKFNDITDFITSFNAQEQVTGNYLALLDPSTRQEVQKELAKPVSNNYFKLQIKARLARFLFHENGYYSISVKDDEMVNKALAVLNSPEYSKLISGK